MELPPALYDKTKRRKAGSSVRLWIATLLVVISGWQLFGLPGHAIQLMRLPEDLLAFGFGTSGVFIKSDGTWIIRRNYYADRAGRYTIAPDGTLTKRRDAGLTSEENVSGSLEQPTVTMPNGHTLKVKPSRSYYEEIKRHRDEIVAKNPKLAGSTSPTWEEQKVTPELEGWKEPYVRVQTYALDRVQVFPVLEGHQYYVVLDAGAFNAPNLWITTDRLKYLHHIYANDATGMVEVRVVKSTPLDIPNRPPFDSSMGMDPSRGLLYLLLPDGRRYWFDPQTLESKGHDKLPGIWDREFAQVNFSGGSRGQEYPSYALKGGWPLSEPAYRRLMRALVLVFVGGLLWLLLEWKAAWKFTSARITADTS